MLARGEGLLMQTQLLDLNLVFPRCYERGYEPLVCWCGKHALDSGCGGQRTARPTTDQVLSKRRAPIWGAVPNVLDGARIENRSTLLGPNRKRCSRT